jgi:uncharacterized protein (TIGR00369 family)
MAELKNLAFFRKYLSDGVTSGGDPRFTFPPPIAKTLGISLTQIDEAMATAEMVTDPAKHANPMGTIHGGVLTDLADLAIGTAHATTLLEGESFTSVDLQINFFRPVWSEKIIASAKPVHRGRTTSRYVCDITRTDGKLIAQVTSTVMTLRGDVAAGR